MTTNTSGAPTGYSGVLFTLKNVKITPSVPAVDQEVKITGNIALFGIPFLALVFITADITLPKAGLDLTNPVAHYETMAIGGKFTIDIPQGFDRQGSFKAEILCYLGPTVKENWGVGGIVTIPPLPNVAAWPDFSFTVSGVLTSDFTVGTPACPIQIYAGDSIKVVVPITNNTTTDTDVTVTMQDKSQDKFLGITWNGDLVNTLTAPVSVPAGKTINVPFTYTETTDIGTRDLIIKVTDINDATVGSGEFDAAYSVIAPIPTTLVISPSTIKVGGNLAFTLNGFAPNDLVTFINQGDSTVLASFSVNAVGYDINSFVYTGLPGSYTLVATGASGKTASASYTVQAAETQYKIVISNPSIPYGGTINFTISGFPAYDQISFNVSGLTVTTDKNGNGSGSFGTSSPAGTYYLRDTSGFGAFAQYIITSSSVYTPGGPPVITLAGNTVIQGGQLSFSIANFETNGYVNVYTPDGSNLSVSTDQTGSGEGEFIDYEPPGTYNLMASDGKGNYAQVSFTVLPSTTPVSFQIKWASALLFMKGTALNPITIIGTNPVDNGNPVTSWTCKYYDPITQALVNGAISGTGPASFSNVNPGGYIVATYTSLSGTTSPIQSTSFAGGAPKGGDIWYFNPFLALTGDTSDLQNNNPNANTNPKLVISNASIQKGGTLSFTITGFLPNESVGVSVVNGGGITVTTDSTGSASGAFPDNDNPGSYTLQAIDSLGNTASATFSIQGIQLNITADSTGYGFVDILANGFDISGTGQVTKGTVITVTAYIYNPAVAKFSGWTDPGNVLGGSTSAGPLNITVNSPVTLTAKFSAITVVTPPPPSGPSFPAPGTVGDGDYWYWIKFSDGSIGWDDYYDIYYGGLSGYTILAGPYASGATS